MKTFGVKRAALGVRMHSGWGVMVAISGDADSVEVLDRRRIVTADPTVPGAKQPYHFAAGLGLREAEIYLANCAAVSERLTFGAIKEVVEDLKARRCPIAGVAVLLASGRPLPDLPSILASHALIHTAEGEFFRDAVKKACELLDAPVTAIKERDLDGQARMTFGNEASRMQRAVSSLGSSIGPPWTKDHKTAALAAAIILTT
jgi:hypothetical protein